MQTLFRFISGMGGLDIVAAMIALLIFMAYVVIVAWSFFRHELDILRGELDPYDEDEAEFSAELAEEKYYPDDEKSWH